MTNPSDPTSPAPAATPTTSLSPELIDQLIDESKPGGAANPYDDRWSTENYTALVARVEEQVRKSMAAAEPPACELTTVQIAQLEHIGLAWMSSTGRKALTEWIDQQPQTADAIKLRAAGVSLDAADLPACAVFVPDSKCRMAVDGLTEDAALRSETADLRRTLSIFFPFLQSVTAMQAYAQLSSLLVSTTGFEQGRCNALADQILHELSRYSPAHAGAFAERTAIAELTKQCTELRAEVSSATAMATGELETLRAALAAGAGRCLTQSDCMKFASNAGIACSDEQALRFGRAVEQHTRPTQRVISLAKHQETLDGVVADYRNMEQQRDELLERCANLAAEKAQTP
jgi:hypothetical protein